MEKIINIIKKNEMISIIAVCSIILLTIGVILIRNNTFAIEGSDELTLTCPKTASAGSEISCTIKLNILSMKGIAFQTNYKLSSGLVYKGFDYNACNSNNCQISDNSLVMFNVGGNMTGEQILGNVKYQIPETAKSNEQYDITLTNAILGGNDNSDNEVQVNFEDVTSSVRILSDTNTLDNLTVSDRRLNETFDKNKNNYSVTVDNTQEKIIVTATKTDELSSVSGHIGEVTLHYGTNNLSITVISETGKENIYTLKVLRPYRLTSEKYDYNEYGNYLYTKNETDNNVILSNLTIPKELKSEIIDDKLVIKYNTEKLSEINIVNISSSKYTIVDNTIYIGKNLDYNEFINNIKLANSNIKIFNENTEITSGPLKENYKIRLYYSGKLLEEYTLVEDYLIFSNNLNIEEANKVLYKIKNNTNIQSILNEISTNGKITVTDKNNNIISSYDNKLKTGDKFKFELHTASFEYQISVKGDAQGDGLINVMDIVKIANTIANDAALDKVYFHASDVNEDNKINVMDIVKIARYIANLDEL